MSVNPIYELQFVQKTFTRGSEASTILNDLCLSIKDGDFVAIMGPSGSGKSTLLNLLGGIDTPSCGDVFFRGKKLNVMSSSELNDWRTKNIGFIFQFYHLMPLLNAYKNVELPLYAKKISKKDRDMKVTAALALVQLEDRQKHYPKELSGGQQQRVAIARAIVTNPDVILCDEPTGDLDRKTADEILDLLSYLNKEYGKTIVMVTHDALAAGYASTVLEMDKGLLKNALPSKS